MRQAIRAAVWLTGLAAGAVMAAGPLEARFANPPDSTKPRCYWYWINGNVSRAGITHDLEAMKRVGIGEGYIGIIGGGELKVLTEEWWGLVEHAVREGTRLGVDIGLFNGPGWSMSGGPWVKPEQSMRYVTLPETRLKGPQHFEGKLSAPSKNFQDVAVIAFPVTKEEGQQANITHRTPVEIHFEMPSPFTARSITIHPIEAVKVNAELQVSEDGQNYRQITTFPIDRSSLGLGVGPVPLAPVVVSFPATAARNFRLKLSQPCKLGDIQLSAAIKVERYAEKSLLKMYQAPLPPYEFYTWPQQPEPDVSAIPAEGVVNLSRQLSADGLLRWDVPPGEWIVLRAGMVPTGVCNAPAPREATGPEVDKMNRAALKVHFDSYVGALMRRIPAAERKSWKHVVADSYEVGSQNWTDDFAAVFRQRYGYDPLRWLPVLSGRVVGSVDQSDRFLWDLRRLVADRMAEDYVGGLRDLCREHGLKLWVENYGHWGFPAEFLKYGGASEEIAGEFWPGLSLGRMEVRCASSAAHIYGKSAVYSEAFTWGPPFSNSPRELKALGDWALCEGINQFVLHVYIHQPDDRRPGVNSGFGTEFNRNNTWFEYAKPWIDYQRRCSVMLQAGLPVADVAYFITEDTPKMTGLRQPALPAGYDYDYINAEVIENRLVVKDGRFVLPDGMSYRLLVLPDSRTMRPALLKKLRQLVADGGTVFGTAPERSPSLAGYPACDAKVKALAGALWGSGKVMTGTDLKPAFERLKLTPDVIAPKDILWKHRREGNTEIYFLANQSPASRTETLSFRVDDKAPEFWWPETGRHERPAVYAVDPGRVRMPVTFGPNTSVFVVFRDKARADRVEDLSRNGQRIFDRTSNVGDVGETVDTFTMAMWVKPEADTVLLPERNSGVSGLSDRRNDVVAARHGDAFGAGGMHVGAGIAVGRNGVAVFEHGSGFFAPVLVHAAPITDWTHVAVVYRAGEPSLYLNGHLVHKGLRSGKSVHGSGTAVDPQYSGKVSGCEWVPCALDEGELAKRMGAPATDGDIVLAGPPVDMTYGEDGKLAVVARAPGRYAWKTADGQTGTREVAAVPAPLKLAGPWEVSFADKGTAMFETLTDWTQRPEEWIKYYSGVATYRNRFEWKAGAGDAGAWRVYLDLGEVCSIARVRVNGEEAGTLWKPPYRVEVTGLLKPGRNRLEIEVVNTWLNRLVGDEQPGAQKTTYTLTKVWNAETKLLPAGLLGPVVLDEE